jgi:hypothetical protein
MGKLALLDTPEDMKWLRDVHLPGLSPEYESAVVHGNEDFPSQIEAYKTPNPTVNSIPAVFLPDPNGDFKVQI